MKIQFSYLSKLAEVASDDDARPALNYVSVDKWNDQDVLVACDGFHLAVVPVELDDVERASGKFIHREALVEVARYVKAHRKPRIKDGDEMIDLVLDEGRIGYPGILLDRQVEDIHYPNWKDIVPPLDKLKATVNVCFDASLLASLAQVFNETYLELRMSGERTAILVETPDGMDASRAREGNPLCAPFGLIMPLHSKRSREAAPVSLYKQAAELNARLVKEAGWPDTSEARRLVLSSAASNVYKAENVLAELDGAEER